MEILSKGTPDGDKEYIWECNICNSKILSKKSECDLVFDRRDGDAVVATCPVCGRKNYINAKLFK